MASVASEVFAAAGEFEGDYIEIGMVVTAFCPGEKF
jgi:hypothetical protein